MSPDEGRVMAMEKTSSAGPGRRGGREGSYSKGMRSKIMKVEGRGRSQQKYV